ncbi:hypothetical protein SH501x_000413 [Pirellulaceae bacterium SH501]
MTSVTSTESSTSSGGKGPDRSSKSHSTDMCWAIACIMIVSGAIHLPLFLLGDMEWEDPVSFRKAVLFGISTGLTLGSILWVFGKLTPWRVDGMLQTALSWSLAVEVLLITLQTWRGVPSHFNTSGWFNNAVEIGMLLMISIASLIIFMVSWRSWQEFSKPSVAPMQSAIWHGLNLLVISVLIGYGITVIGKILLWQGLAPELLPPRGALKFPHGAGLHAIQALPFIAWITSRAPVSMSHAAVRWGAWTYYASLVFALEQTLRGRERFELDAAGALLFLMASVCGAFSAFLVLRSLLNSDRSKEHAI